VTKATPNKKFNEQNNGCARAFLILVHFFAVLCKTTTWYDQVLCILEKEKYWHSKVKYKFVFHKVSSPPSPSSLLKLPNKPIWWLTWKHALGERNKFPATISLYGACSEDILVQRSLGTRVNPDTIGYVWTGEFDLNTLRVDGETLNPERKSCGFKNIRIRVDRALIKLWTIVSRGVMKMSPNREDQDN